MRSLLLIAAIAACDTVHDEPPTWSYIHAAIIAPSCATASCHSKISSVAGRDMSTPHAAYTAMTSRVCGAPSHAGMDDIENARSLVMSALRGTQFLIMPPDQPLPDVEIELIDRWYAAGAPCD